MAESSSGASMTNWSRWAENMRGCASRACSRSRPGLNWNRQRKLPLCQFLLRKSNYLSNSLWPSCSHGAVSPCEWITLRAPRQSEAATKTCAIALWPPYALLLPQSVGGEPEGAGDGWPGITMVCPACNLRPSSMLLAFCSSSTLTLYIFAIDVSVSPRATV
jgi:hypothetical protein